MSENTVGVALIVLLALITVLSGAMLSQTPKNTDPYCEMTQIYKDSNGEFGWPEYRGKDACK